MNTVFIRGSVINPPDIKKYINDFQNDYNYHDFNYNNLIESVKLLYGGLDCSVYLDNGSSVIIDKLIKQYDKIVSLKGDFYYYNWLSDRNVKIFKEFDGLDDLIDENCLFIFSLVRNSDGNVIDLNLLIDKLKTFKYVKFAIDVAYIEYANISYLKIKNLIDNGAIVLGTFSKFYGLPNIRVGYVINNPCYDNIPYQVSELSCFIANSILKDVAHNNLTYEILESQCNKFKELGLKETHSKHKFITEIDCYDYFLYNGYRLTKLQDGLVSVTVCDSVTNEKFINLFREYYVNF